MLSEQNRNQPFFYLHAQRAEPRFVFCCEEWQRQEKMLERILCDISFMHNIIFRMHEHLIIIITHTRNEKWKVESRRARGVKNKS